jgi:signal transduction histidine kinase
VRVASHLSDPKPAWLHLPADPSGGFFGAARRLVNDRPRLTDGLLAAGLLAASTIWLVGSPYANPGAALVQVALVVPLAWRRSRPTAVFVGIAAMGLLEWIFGSPLIANGAVLVALYSVAVHEPRVRALAAAATSELGAFLASARWHPADTLLRSVAFLTATVVAALCAGLTVRSGSEYLAWLAERSRRLEVERDQQASIAAAGERARIAREMHDIVAHSLSVLITLVDAAVVVNRTDPDRAEDALGHASDVGRRALGDMRTMIGVLRTDTDAPDLLPQPGLGQLDALLGGVRATGLDVRLEVEGRPFPLGAAAELSVYRIVQESLTNTLKHGATAGAHVTLRYRQPVLRVQVRDDPPGPPVGEPECVAGSVAGTPPVAARPAAADGVAGHGIGGMRERAALHRGSLVAGPDDRGRWTVTATLRIDPTMATH